MNILITGGTGLIGRELVRQLLGAGDTPIVLSRRPEAGGRLPDGVQVHLWDGETTQGWGEIINDVDAVINLAGENISGRRFFPARWTKMRKERILQSRLKAGLALVEAIQNAGRKPAVLIQASAIGYYGTHGDAPLTENAPPGDDFIARIAQQWEAVTAPVEALGVRRVILRTGVVLSLAGGALPRLLLPYRMFVGGAFGSGRQWYSWVHIDDVGAAIRFLIAHEQAHGPVNLTAPNPLPNADFGSALGRVLRRPSWLPLPGFVLRTMFGEVSTVVLDGQRVLPEQLLRWGYTFRFPNVETAFRDLLRKV